MEIFNCKETKEKRRVLRKNLTDAEKALWKKLRGKRLEGLKFFRQHGIGTYIADFYHNDAEDHGRKPVGESVPAEGWKKGSDMICSGHGNKAECSWAYHYEFHVVWIPKYRKKILKGDL